MGNCLVTKLKAVIDNENLRMLDELRVDIYPINGTPATLNFQPMTENNAYSEIIKYRLLSGDGYISRNNVIYNDELDIANSASCTISSGEKVGFSIKNFNNVTTVLGTPNNTFTLKPMSGTWSLGVIRTEDIGGKIFLKSISTDNSLAFVGNTSQLNRLVNLEYLKLEDDNTLNYCMRGSLSSLSNCKKLEYILINSGLTRTTNITYSISDLVSMTALNKFLVDGKNEGGGGDIYQLFRNKSNIDYYFRDSYGATFSCSYTNGNTIHQTELKLLDFYGGKNWDKDNLIRLLTMVKDGINAGKITLSAISTGFYNKHIRTKSDASVFNSTEVQTLVSELSNLGCVVVNS